MNIENVKKRTEQLLQGASFEQLVSYLEGMEMAGTFNSDIESVIMDKMIELDAEKFMKWEEEYNN